MKTTVELQAGRINTQAWAPILELAVREVFERMLSCKVTTPETLAEEPLDITAMIGLAGPLRGVLGLQCSYKSAAPLACKMLGIEESEVSPEASEAFGEICNMIAGNFKSKIAELGSRCLLSLPAVVMGNDCRLRALAASPALELKLLVENMPVVISLTTHTTISEVQR